MILYEKEPLSALTVTVWGVGCLTQSVLVPTGSVRTVWQEVASVSAIKAGKEPSVLKVITHTLAIGISP